MKRPAYRLTLRLVAVTVFASLLGVVITQGLTRRDVESSIARSSGAALFSAHAREHALCEASPATFRSGVRDVSVFAYDSATLVSANPAAPPLDRALVARLHAGTVPDAAASLPRFGRPGALVVNVAARGPCAILQASWAARGPLRGHDFLLALAGAPAALVSALLALVLVAGPLLRRIARLRRAAVHLGHSEYSSASLSGQDELGELSRVLDRAHTRIAEDAIELDLRQLDLQRYLADVSHDLRTPLSSLQILLEQAADARDDVESKGLIEAALRDVVYLGGLTSNLGLASQLREGWDPVRPAALANLSEVMTRVTARSRIFATRLGIEMDVAVPDEQVMVDCDLTAAEQAFANVVDNAVTHGRAGGHVAVVLEIEDGDVFVVTVVDDGPGVAPSELPRLGERTFRADAARQRDPRGRGLGLAITTAICERCSWIVSFEAQEPRGLCVRVRGHRSAAGR